MPLTLSNLKPKKGSKKGKKRVGRGGKRGTYSGRGQKGQRARSGGKKGLKLKGFKSLMHNIPKLRGFKSRKKKMAVINLEDLEKKFNQGETIDLQKLKEIGLIKKSEKRVKILAKGKLTKKLTVKAHAFSKSAEEEIKKAGGEVIKIE